MREKARDFIYLDTKRYISLDSLRVFYWATIIFPFFMVVISIVAMNTNGISLGSLFPLISIVIWSLLYWIFVLTIQNKRIKKTFQLRFLVNGISGMVMSSLFWMFYTSFNLVADNPVFGLDFSLWILFFYLLFSVIYMGLTVVGVHKGVYKKIHEKSHAPKVIAIDAFLASIMPITGVCGILTSKLLRTHASIEVQEIVVTLGFVLIIFIPALAHINFVQYFYCKKYRILCDEYGDSTSPKLERQIKVKKNIERKETYEKTEKLDQRQEKKQLPLILKILIGVVSVPIIFFSIIFFVFFVKGFIQGIS